MTLEESLARQAINLGRIADALETLVSAQGLVPDDQQQLDFAKPAEEKPADNSHKKPPAINAEKPAAKKKTKKKKKKNEIVVGKVDEEKPEWNLPGIRALLHKLQEQENQAAVKSVLKKFGASTLGQVDEKKFVQLAKAIEKQLDD